MANDPQGLAGFPGIELVKSADYTMSHGITPGVCTLVCAPQPGFEAIVGPLVFTFGSAAIELPDCKIESHLYQQNAQGQLWFLTIHDRRWKWQWGEISGSYNLRFDDGSLDPGRQVDAQTLATLCLIAMGETAWDVSTMPADANPLVEWDRANPAQALAALADQVGCRVVLGLDNLVHVIPTGVGAALPGGAVREQSATIKIPDMPQSLVVSCGKTRYQCDFGLQAVGLELDGSIVPIGKLSYTPQGGWDNVEPDTFQHVVPAAALPYAEQSVYRWYRINTSRDGSPLVLPGYGPIQNGFQVIPIEDEQVQTYEDVGVKPPPGAPANAQKKHNLPAQVFGVFFRGDNDFKNTAPNTKHNGKFTIDKSTGVVEFEDAMTANVFLINDAAAQKNPQGMTAASLYLRTACSVRDPLTWAWGRYFVERTINNVPTPPRVLRHEEIILSVYPVYDARGRVASVKSNQGNVDRESKVYLDAAQAEYQQTSPQEYGYAGIVPISLDGAIQQVSWHVGAPFASTRAGRNNEFSIVVPSYDQRRQAEQFWGGQFQDAQKRLARIEREIEKNA